MKWPTKIALAFAAFIVFIGYIVVQTFQENIDLEADNYYAQELAFQDQIDKKMNLSALGETVAVTQLDDAIFITLPDALRKGHHEGTVTFYRPQDKRMDRSFALELSEEGEHRTDKSGLIPGRYQVQLDWTTDGTPYYFEYALFVH